MMLCPVTFSHQPRVRYASCGCVSLLMSSCITKLFQTEKGAHILTSCIAPSYPRRSTLTHTSPAWVFSVSSALVRIPDNILQAALWTIMVYWAVGFAATAGQ